METIYRNRAVVYVLLLCLLLIPPFLNDIEDHPFHGDESWWTRCGAEYFTLFFLERDFDNKKWHSYMGVDQPQIGRYIIGMRLWLAGGKPLLEKAYQHPFYQFEESGTWNRENGRVPPLEILLPVRLMTAAFGLCGCFLIYYIGYRAFSPEVGFISSLLIGCNPLLLLYARRAVTDAPLFFFMTAVVALLPTLLCQYRKHNRIVLYATSCLIGILVGIAAGIKLNGGLIGLIFACWMGLLAWEAFLGGSRQPEVNTPRRVDRSTPSCTDTGMWCKERKLKQFFDISFVTLIVGTTAVSTFYIASPNLYGTPVSGAKQLIDHRMGIVSGQQDGQQSKAIRTSSEKIKQTYMRLFDPATSYSVVKFPSRIPLELLFFIVGIIGVCISEYNYVRTHRHFSFQAFVFLWVFLLFIGIVAWIPLDWGRYYLPMFPAQTMMVAVGITTSFSWLYSAIHRAQHTGNNNVAI